MRISADPQHPAFSSRALHAHVYLDGEPLKNCITADDDAGTAECYEVDARGGIIYDGVNAQLVTLRGRVSLTFDGMDFDAWMRQRTEWAHAEFMRRTNALSELRPKYASGGVVAGMALIGEAGPELVDFRLRSAPCAN